MADPVRLSHAALEDVPAIDPHAAARAREDLFATLVEDCLPALRIYARNLCGDPHMADDCVQDACVRALGAFAVYDASRPFRPWISRILRNESLQRLRRDRRMTHLPDEAINDILVDARTPVTIMSDSTPNEAATKSVAPSGTAITMTRPPTAPM